MLLKYHLHYALTYQMRPSDANWFGLESYRLETSVSMK